MYKYENPARRGKSLDSHKTESVERKKTIEFKRDPSSVPKVNVKKAMGILSNAANKSSAYIQRAESDKGAIQLSSKIKGSHKHQAPPAPPPRQRLRPEDITAFSADSYNIDQRLKDSILLRPMRSPIIVDGKRYYHIPGDYDSRVGKLIWTINENNEIRVEGLYEHYGNSNKKYRKREGLREAPGTIEIK